MINWIWWFEAKWYAPWAFYHGYLKFYTSQNLIIQIFKKLYYNIFFWFYVGLYHYDVIYNSLIPKKILNMKKMQYIKSIPHLKQLKKLFFIRYFLIFYWIWRKITVRISWKRIFSFIYKFYWFRWDNFYLRSVP